MGIMGYIRGTDLYALQGKNRNTRLDGDELIDFTHILVLDICTYRSKSYFFLGHDIGLDYALCVCVFFSSSTTFLATFDMFVCFCWYSFTLCAVFFQ
jgi:hypothetical protein